MALSDDGKTLAVANGRGHIDVIDTGRREVKTTLHREGTESFNYSCHLSVSRDGRFVLGVSSFGRSVGSFGRVEIWGVATGQMRKSNFEGIHRLAFSPDGGTIAVAVNRSRLLLFDAKTGKEKPAGNPVPRGAN
jgi:tricorn protease-like protein